MREPAPTNPRPRGQNGKSSAIPGGPSGPNGVHADHSAAVGEAAEKTMAQAKDAYARMKTATVEATGVAEETYKTARTLGSAMNLKALELGQSNANAFFAFYKDLVSAKTTVAAIELQTKFAQSQFDALSGQIKDLQESARKAAVEIAQPVRTAYEKAFKAHQTI